MLAKSGGTVGRSQGAESGGCVAVHFDVKSLEPKGRNLWMCSSNFPC